MKLSVLLAICLPAFGWQGQELLDRVSQRVHANARNMPRYTCEEAIERFWYQGNALERSDRIRLDVAVGSGGEMFAWHGDRSFKSGHIDDLVQSGPISSGTFASFVKNIFAPKTANMNFRGDGKFTYSMPLERSTFLVSAGAAKAISAYEGYFTADPSTGRLKTVEVTATKLPHPSMRGLSIRIDYASAKLGDADVELPTTVEMTVTDSTGGYTRNVTQYRNCRQFIIESTIHFDDDPVTQTTDQKTEEGPFSLDPGKSLTIRIASDVHPESAAAGDRIEGILTSNLPGAAQKGPAHKGATLTGHLIRVESVRQTRPYYNVDLVFDELIDAGVPHPVSLESITIPLQPRRDRTQSAVQDGTDRPVCRFRTLDRKDNLKGAVTYWRSR